MNTSIIDEKEEKISNLLKVSIFLNVLKHHFLSLLIYGIVFNCIVFLLIAANTLMNDRHLHVSVTVDNKETVMIDLKNRK
ncbi:MAG TPA: hypothetical protein PLJ88_03725 [Agitococcus sp.]|nr:hypothetical protein [Pseudomonadales bacterium]HQV22178.1 hypothetical protein [Agitococcus sp.]